MMITHRASVLSAAAQPTAEGARRHRFRRYRAFIEPNATRVPGQDPGRNFARQNRAAGFASGGGRVRKWWRSVRFVLRAVDACEDLAGVFGPGEGLGGRSSDQ